MKRTMIIAALCGLLLWKVWPAVVMAQDTGSQTQADAAWLALQEVASERRTQEEREDPGKYMAANELQARRYRELGIQFYRQFPDSPHRLEWIMGSVGALDPRYYRDLAAIAAGNRSGGIEIDDEARQTWEKLYRETLRPALLEAHRASGDYPRFISDIRYLEWRRESQFMFNDMKLGHSPGEAQVRALLERLFSYVEADPEPLRYLSDIANFFHWPETWGLSAADEGWLIEALRHSGNAPLREFGEGRARLHAWRTQPAEWHAVAMDGQTIDLRQLRGKVVLLNFWGSVCESCQSEMKKYQALVKRYGKAGFEVIGISTDYEGFLGGRPFELVPKKLRWMKQQGITWPQVLGGKMQDGTTYRDYFGIATIPVSVLLDRDGRLVTTEVLGRDLGPLLAQLLGLPKNDRSPEGSYRTACPCP